MDMSNAMLDLDSIVANNPQISVESLRRIDSLVKRIKRLGIQETPYRLASPFSSSLKKMRKGRRREASSERE